MFDFIKAKISKERDKKMIGCVHDPISDDSTLIQGSISSMVYPKEYQFVCRNCGKNFKYIQNKNGDFERVVSCKNINK